MNGCIYRTKDNECELWEKDRNCTAFCHPNCENIHPSNADRIRAMTDEDLANAITNLIASMIDVDDANRGFYHDEILKCLKREARF